MPEPMPFSVLDQSRTENEGWIPVPRRVRWIVRSAASCRVTTLMPSFLPDGLLEPFSLDDLPAVAFGRSDQPVIEELRRVGDVRLLSQIVWPASMDGVLVRPPDIHLVDWIVRTYLLQDPPASVGGAIALRPEAHTMVAIESLPCCDYCQRPSARYDSALKGGGRWATMCSDCYTRWGGDWLGMGRGQYLTIWDEMAEATSTAVANAIDYWKSHGLDAPALAFV
jgi:hypothetical protein